MSFIPPDNGGSSSQPSPPSLPVGVSVSGSNTSLELVTTSPLSAKIGGKDFFASDKIIIGQYVTYPSTAIVGNPSVVDYGDVKATYGIDSNFPYGNSTATSISANSLVFCASSAFQACSFRLLSTVLATLNIPLLEAVQGILYLGAIPLGATINAPKLAYVAGITLQGAGSSQVGLFPSLKNIGPGGIAASSYSGTSMTVGPVTDIAGSITLSGLGNVQTVSFPALTNLAGSASISSLPSLTSISFPAVQRIGAGIFTSTTPSLATIDLGSSLKFVGGSISIIGAALSQSQVDMLLAKLAALDGTNGTTLYQNQGVAITGGTSAAPSASGLASKAILVSRGCSVTHN